MVNVVNIELNAKHQHAHTDNTNMLMFSRYKEPIDSYLHFKHWMKAWGTLG